MQFNPFTIVALLLLLLTGNALADNRCYTAGNTWSDLGDDSVISDAFTDICKRMAGDRILNQPLTKCVNVGENHIDTNIWPEKGPNGQTFGAVKLTEEGCMDLMNQIKNRCPDYGGELTNLETNPDTDGGDWILAQARADPEPSIRNC